MSRAWATAVCAGRGIGGDAVYLPCFHARILENEVLPSPPHTTISNIALIIALFLVFFRFPPLSSASTGTRSYQEGV